MNKTQLFCFTFAGGTAAFFDEIEKELPELQLVKTDYPGHGARHKEPFAADYDALTDDVFSQVKNRYTGGTYGLFGYSMGSVTLVEVLRRILDDPEINNPFHVFLAAHEPRTKTELKGFTEDELNEWIKNRTLQFGGIPETLIYNKPFWRMYLPIYRADYTLLKNYQFEKLALKTDIPATVFYSETDTPGTGIEKWQKYFRGECEFHSYEGNHFFIRQHCREMAAEISRAMGL